MTELENLQKKYISYLEIKNELIVLCGRDNGFFTLYKVYFPKNTISESNYATVAKAYFDIVGINAFESYAEFLNFINPVVKTVVKTINADLKKWYVAKGFNTFSKLQPIVKNFYPEVPVKDILDFWNNKPINADSLQCIGYVKQILE